MRRSRLLSGSIAARLFWGYGLSSFLILAAASAALYLDLKADLKRAGREFLDDKLRVLNDVLNEVPSDPEELAEQIRYNSSSDGLFRIYVRKLDAAGRTVVESPGMPPALTAAAFAGLGDRPVHRRRFLLLREPVTRRGEEGTLQIALDLERVFSLMHGYRRRLALAMALGAALLGMAGAWISARGLRPLGEISRAMHRMTALDLHRRLDPGDWPSELGGLAASFNTMLDRLDESFTSLSQFSADLAHELRTPLHALRTQAEVTLARPRGPEEYRQALEGFLEECGRLSGMTENLLFLAKSENRRSAVQCARLDARACCAAVLDFYEAAFEERGVRAELQGEAELTADEGLLRRAVSNLVSNALKFSPAGGRILVRVARGDGRGMVRVEDQGPGIPAPELGRVTERFFRGTQLPGSNPEGLGLGLAIVATILKLHNGTLTLANLPAPGGLAVELAFPDVPVGGGASPESDGT